MTKATFYLLINQKVLRFIKQTKKKKIIKNGLKLQLHTIVKVYIKLKNTSFKN